MAGKTYHISDFFPFRNVNFNTDVDEEYDISAAGGQNNQQKI